MKHCPTCSEEFEDELNYCMFDGAVLHPPGVQNDSGGERDERRVDRWKVAFFGLLGAILVASVSFGGSMFYRGADKAVEAKAGRKSVERSPLTPSRDADREPVTQPQSFSKLGRAEILEIIPKHVVGWFRDGVPNEIKVVAAKDIEYLVLLGIGRSASGAGPAERVLALVNDGEEFKDVTRQVLPASFGSGLFGPRSQVKFDAGGSKIILRVPASSNKIVDECPSCEHAYQRITLEWKDGRYVESERAWDNDRYTAFYVVAEALEHRRVDTRARPLIDRGLDGVLSRGFDRVEQKGWIVENLTEDDQASTAEYQLRNGADRLTITVSRMNGRWKATRVSG